jgi:hypothetical protein
VVKAGKFGVHGVTSAGAGHAISGIDVCNALAYGENRASATITQRTRLIETAAHRRNSRRQSIAADFVQDFADEVRTHSRFLQ